MPKLLIVDDSRTVREHLGRVLRGGGFDVVEVEDGAAAVEQVNEDRDIEMVILDVNMPRMNGLEALERIKGDARNASLPIVMLTTESQLAVVERAKKAGAKGWIVKPFRPELLLAAVHRILALSA